ncbi:uncharacterized protein [Heterodontus francisci]|uniref:uncharacterized protein n=1 Tax=Heterodontus francisci TaxID=7792 RepID=UPI00355B5AAD
MVQKLFLAVILSLCVVGITEASAIIQTPELIDVREGSSVHLQCAMENGNVGNTDVEWKLLHENSINDKVIGDQGSIGQFQPSRDSKYNSFILTIRNIQQSDTGTYYCEIIGKNRFIKGKGTKIEVRGDSFPILSQPEVQNISEGHTAQLQCSVNNIDLKNTDLHWYRRSLRGFQRFITHRAKDIVEMDENLRNHFQSTRDVSKNEVILTISNILLEDATVYYCTVWSDVYGSGTQLNVIIVPVLIQSPILERVTEGHTVRLQCTMWNAAVRDTDVHWYRELPGQNMEWILTHDIMNSTRRSPGFTDRFQSSRDTSNNSFILTIKHVQPNDTAVYYCKVWGDISGNGTQIIVTKAWTPDLFPIILGSLLGFLLLLVITVIILLYVKQWLCCTNTSTQNRLTMSQVTNGKYENSFLEVAAPHFIKSLSSLLVMLRLAASVGNRDLQDGDIRKFREEVEIADREAQESAKAAGELGDSMDGSCEKLTVQYGQVGRSKKELSSSLQNAQNKLRSLETEKELIHGKLQAAKTSLRQVEDTLRAARAKAGEKQTGRDVGIGLSFLLPCVGIPMAVAFEKERQYRKSEVDVVSEDRSSLKSSITEDEEKLNEINCQVPELHKEISELNESLEENKVTELTLKESRTEHAKLQGRMRNCCQYLSTFQGKVSVLKAQSQHMYNMSLLLPFLEEAGVHAQQVPVNELFFNHIQVHRAVEDLKMLLPKIKDLLLSQESTDLYMK